MTTTNIYAAFETVTEGRWFEIVVNGEEVCRVQLMPIDADLNPKLRAKMVEAGLELREELGRFPTPEEMRPHYLAEAIVAWSGVKDRDGQVMSCNHANKFRVMSELPKLASRLEKFADDWINYLKVAADDAVGNSQPSSKSGGGQTGKTGTKSAAPPVNAD